MIDPDKLSIVLAIASGGLWIAAAFVSFKAPDPGTPFLVAFDGIDLRRTWKWQKLLNGLAAFAAAGAALVQGGKLGL
jgi:hypothetical protein